MIKLTITFCCHVLGITNKTVARFAPDERHRQISRIMLVSNIPKGWYNTCTLNAHQPVVCLKSNVKYAHELKDDLPEKWAIRYQISFLGNIFPCFLSIKWIGKQSHKLYPPQTLRIAIVSVVFKQKIQTTGSRFVIKTSRWVGIPIIKIRRVWISHHKDKIVVKPSFLNHGNSCAAKAASLVGNGSQYAVILGFLQY